MNLSDSFLVAGGSVPGTEHTKPGQPGWKNNQDAFAWHCGENSLVAVVCDGCGSSPNSEVGAKIGAQITARFISSVSLPGQYFYSGMEDPDILCESLVRLKEDLRWNLFDALDVMCPNGTRDGSREQLVEDFLLFTVICVVINDKYAVIFSMGDGVWALNGELRVIPSFPDNAPPYIGNLLRARSLERPTSDFVVHSVMKTSDVQSALIGSDGVKDFISASDLMLPGKKQPVGPLSQFWAEDRYVANSDNIRRRLALANLETVDGSRIKPGLLSDDTTIVVVRRKHKEE